jgi:AraC-like DNA-binding protein
MTGPVGQEGAESASLPLAGYEQVRTRDVDEARALVASAFCGHQLLPIDGSRSVDTRFHSVRFGNVGLSYLDYGAPVRIAPDEFGNFFLVLLPLEGTAEIVCGRDRIVSDPSVGALPSPDERLTMRWSEDHRQMIVWIDRHSLEAHLTAMLGKPPRTPLSFDLGMDTRRRAIQSWRNVVDLLRREIDTHGTMPAEPLVMTEFERLLFSQLLLGQPNNYSAALQRIPSAAAPRVIRNAVDIIEGHAAEPLTVEDVAEAVGIGVRALQQGFRRYLDTTPMNYLRDVRFRRVRAELAASDPNTTSVTDIAVQWGFYHGGRFAVQYRERFGEVPSATLRR